MKIEALVLLLRSQEPQRPFDQIEIRRTFDILLPIRNFNIKPVTSGFALASPDLTAFFRQQEAIPGSSVFPAPSRIDQWLPERRIRLRMMARS